MSTERLGSSPDDGELSDHSGQDYRSAKNSGSTNRRSSSPESVHGSPSVGKKKEKTSKATNISDEEDRLRRRLLERRENDSKHHHHSGDEEEMFTIQPGDGKSRSTDRDRGDRLVRDRDRDRMPERDRQLPKHKHDRKDRERHDDRGHRSKHDRVDRGDRLAGRLTMGSTSNGRDVRPDRNDRPGRSDRERPKERDRRERDDRKGGKHDRERKKHKRSKSRSRSRSSSADDRTKKRDRRISDKEKKREKREGDSKDRIHPDESHSDNDNASTTVVVQSETLSMEVTEIVDDSTPRTESGTNERVEPPGDEITAFTLDSPAGPKKYSKFDSSPEIEDDDRTPIQSDVEMRYSDDEEDVQEVDFDVSTARYEDLTEEQKIMLSPDTKKHLEDAWQKRLIAQLPVFYPGIMGCRNVNEFYCENKVEEGTYGVVFRARDKRTDEIVALKRLKMEKEKEGFPITSLREINMLLKAGNHCNIVNVREVLIGNTMDKIFVAMEFVEHDMKNLMDIMSKRGKHFSIGEQKTLMIQLLSGLKHMHDLWILHRDLKTSNLLLSHKGILKIADFGLAREFGSPLKPYTQIVVTLWYRAPELLLGQRMYSTPIDMWSVGCIMAEFILLKPLFPGKGEIDQINKIFLELGTPTEKIWPGYEELPVPKQASFAQYPYNQLRKKFPAKLVDETGFKLMNELLRYDPSKRIDAEDALLHPWFTEAPQPTPPEMFPTFPAKSEQHKAPPPQKRPATQPEVLNAGTAKLLAGLNVRPDQMKSGGFALKFDKNPF